MRILFLCIAIVFSTPCVWSQTLEWARQFGGTGNNLGNAIAVDGAGNVYTTGFFRETVDFDPGPGTFNLTSAGNNDVFITKLDPMGNLLWAKRFGGAGNDVGFDIFVDNAGNVYTTGSFRGNVDFDPGPNTFFLFSDGEDDIFVSKLNTNGDFLWARRVGGTGDDLGRAIVADNMGNVFVAGQFRNTVDFDPGPNAFNLSSSGAEDAFILKLNAIGDFEWARKLGSNSNDFCRGIALDALNNVHVIGSFRNTVTLTPNPTTVSLTSNGNSDIFVLKFNTNGNLIWAESFGGTGNDFGHAIAIDGAGNILTTGNFQLTADFNPKAGTFSLTSAGAADVFVSKLSGTGDLIWAKRFGGPVNDFGYGIGVDAVGNVYTTGAFQSTANFQTGAGFFNLTSGGWNDVYVSKLDSNGDFSWAQQFGGTADNLGYGIDVSGSGNVYTTGRFGGVINFDAGGSNTSLTTAGSFDVFVSKINQCPSVSGTDVQTACGTFTWIDGVTYTSNNNSAVFTIAGGAASGCDSVVTLDLTLLNNAAGTDTITTCNAYTWIDGNTYSTNNTTATFTLTGAAANGCDSVVTLHLTFVNAATATDVVTACDAFTWIDNNTYTANNNTATVTIPNGAANGCDSIVTLNLTINNTATGTDVVTACESFTWIDNMTYSANNNTATVTIPNGAANGCDSVVTLNLTINNAATGTDVVTACDTFTWIDNNTYTANNNTATVTIPNGAANGCDSIVTLNLTINNTATGTDVVTACDAFTWIDNMTYTANNNTATVTIPNGAANGCDSVVALQLTINRVTDNTISVTGTTLTANNPNASYQWLDCDNAFTAIWGATNQSFIPVVNGNYAVALIENGCNDTSICEAITTIGTVESTLKNDIQIFPNPTNGLLNIAIGNRISDVEITIVNFLGQELFRKTYPSVEIIRINLAGPVGVYTITATVLGENKVFKVIKQ
jgi:hypothetical protein